MTPRPVSILLFAVALALLSGAAGAAESMCDPELAKDSKSPLAYRLRGDRCEGIYAQQVSAPSLEVRSLASFGAFDPARDPEVELAWQAPPGRGQQVRLRAFSFEPGTYYRMDTARPAVSGAYRWTTDVLAAAGPGPEDLGLVAWVALPGPSGTTREVFLPLRVGRNAAPGADGYEVSLVPSVRLKEVRVTVHQLDDRGEPVATLRRAEELGDGYYPSNERTVFTTGRLGPAAFYRVELTATTASGSETVTHELDLYHPGD